MYVYKLYLLKDHICTLVLAGLLCQFLWNSLESLPVLLTMAEFASVTDIPPTRIIVRGRTEYSAFLGPPPSNLSPATNTTNISLSPIPALQTALSAYDLRGLAPVYSPNGTSLCLTTSVAGVPHVCIVNPANGNETHRFAVSDLNYVKFSPLGNFLITWSHHKTQKPGT